MYARNPRAIYSDDPQAVQKLQSKLKWLEARQEHMKAVNKVVKKHGGSELAQNILKEMGLTPQEILGVITLDFMGRIGYPAWELSNNNAEIRRIKQRLGSLQKEAA